MALVTAVAMQAASVPQLAQRPLARRAGSQAPRRACVVRSAVNKREEAAPLAPAPRNAALAAATALFSATAAAAHAAAETVPAEEFDISKLTPLDVLILLGPLLAYGVFYAIREQYSPTPRRRPDAPATPPPAAPAASSAPTVVKAAPSAAPPPAAYTGPVTRLLSGRDAFDLVCNVAAETLQVDRSSFSEKTRLRDLGMTNEDAKDITKAIGERSGIAWQDTDWQNMRVSLLQQNLLEISHLVSDRAGIPRLDYWPVTKPPAEGGVDFV